MTDATKTEPIGYLHSNGEFCQERPVDSPEWWPISLYPQSALDAAVLAAVAEHKAEIERLRKDAERYRWLRTRAYKDGGTLAIDVAVIDDVALGDFGAFIDATADAAIKGATDDQG